MATVTRKITADEFLAMDLGEGLHELVRGEIVEMPPPGPKHGMICLNAGGMLHEYGRRTGHGYAIGNDSVVGIDEYSVRGADVQYFREDRWPKSQVGDGLPPVPPDLVVEVVSPSDRPAKVLEKVAEYLAAGVGMVWVLNPKDATLTIHRAGATPIVLAAADSVENLPELPGFRCQVAEFFA